MKRETIERHLREVSAERATCKDLDHLRILYREQERLNESLAKLDAKEVKPKEAKPKEVPGFTDGAGDFYEFVETSQGWCAVHITENGLAYAHGVEECYALRSWLKETGRR